MILHRYIFRELCLVFAITLVAITLICLVAIVFQIVRTYADLGLGFILQFTPIVLGYTLPYILPVAGTAAATFVFSRLSANNEIMAMRASGIHTLKIILPALVFGGILFLICLYVNQTITPRANHTRRMLVQSAIRYILSAPPPMRSSIKIQNYLIDYQEYKNGVFMAPMIRVLEQRQDDHGTKYDELSAEYHARQARLTWVAGGEPALTLTDATGTKYVNGKPAVETPAKGELTIPIEFSEKQTKKQSGMTAAELRHVWETHPEQFQRNRALFEYYARYARSIACFILILCGVVVGCWVRKGTKLVGFGVSIPILVLYFLLTLLVDATTEANGLNMFLMAFAPVTVMAVACAVPLIRLFRT